MCVSAYRRVGGSSCGECVPLGVPEGDCESSPVRSCRESREKRSLSRQTIDNFATVRSPNAINSIVPSGTDASFQILPSNELLGYCHDVPPGPRRSLVRRPYPTKLLAISGAAPRSSEVGSSRKFRRRGAVGDADLSDDRVRRSSLLYLEVLQGPAKSEASGSSDDEAQSDPPIFSDEVRVHSIPDPVLCTDWCRANARRGARRRSEISTLPR